MQPFSNAEIISSTFRMLSVNTRVRIIELLKVGPVCVNGLARQLGITAAAVSQHLRLMRDAGIVTSARRGYFVHYELDPETFRRLRGLAEHFFELQAQDPRPTAGTCCQSSCCQTDCRHASGSRREQPGSPPAPGKKDREK